MFLIGKTRGEINREGHLIHRQSAIRLARLGAMLLLLFFMCVLSGCATIFMLPKLGERSDHISSYVKAVRRGDQLIIFYRVDTRSSYSWSETDYPKEQSRNWVALNVARWSIIDLKKVQWRVLEGYDLDFPVVLMKIRDEPRPEVYAPPDEEVPIVLILKEQTDPDVARYILADKRSTPLTVYTFTPNGHLVLVTSDPDKPNKIFHKVIYAPYRIYREGWAIPARVTLFPAAVVIDIVTSPVQLVYFLLLLQMH